MSLDLSSSLTAMEWLPRLRVGGSSSSSSAQLVAGSGQVQSMPPLVHAPGTTLDYHHFGRMPLHAQRHPASGRKLPPSPIDLTAVLDPLEAQAYRYHDAKPPYSYATLITYAINSSPKRRMTLNEIYTWICNNFPYYREAGTGWKVMMNVVSHYTTRYEPDLYLHCAILQFFIAQNFNQLHYDCNTITSILHLYLHFISLIKNHSFCRIQSDIICRSINVFKKFPDRKKILEK